MVFRWKDISNEDFPLAESWLDDDAKHLTGLDEGIKDYYDYYANDPHYKFGSNFWIKIITKEDDPAGVIALYLSEDGVLTVCEFLIPAEKRNMGIGSAALSELVENAEAILGKSIVSAFAVVFPNNIPSQRAFEKAGFKFDGAHPDGDAWYYAWNK